MDEGILKATLAAYPMIEKAELDLLDTIRRKGQSIRVTAGTHLFDPEVPCQIFPLVATGVIRVGKIGEKGRELVLYRVNPGEYCVLSLCGLISGGVYPAYALAEGEVSGLVLPQEIFEQLFVQVPGFRRSVFTNLWLRLGSLIDLVSEFAFLRLDQRVAALLLRLSDDSSSSEVQITHQAMANQIGSSREIVSRALEMLAARGMVSLQRGRVTVDRPVELRRLITAIE